MKILKKRIICFISAAMLLISSLTPAGKVFSDGPDIVPAEEYEENRIEQTEASNEAQPADKTTETSVEKEDAGAAREDADSIQADTDADHTDVDGAGTDVDGTVVYNDENRRITLAYTTDAAVPSDAELYIYMSGARQDADQSDAEQNNEQQDDARQYDEQQDDARQDGDRTGDEQQDDTEQHVNISDGKLDAAIAALGLSPEDYVYYSEYFVMELRKQGERIIPAAPVTVSIEMPDAANEAVFRTVIFGEDGAKEIDCITSDKTVVFSTSELSAFCIIGAVSPVISENTDVAELSVFTLDSDTATIADSDSIEVPEEGYETLIAVELADSGDETSNWIKTGLSENAVLGEGENIALYSVEDGAVTDVIIPDIADNSDVQTVDSGVTAVALVKDTGLRHLNFEIHPEGSEALVVLDGMMPREASAEAYDVTGEQADSDGETTLAAYDISIINGDDEYQPGNQPVRVEITDSRITAGKIALYHINDSGEREEVTGFEVLDGSISFDAYGFSIYKVVEISTPDDEGYSGVDITSDETAVDFTANKVDGTEAFVYDVVSYPQNTPEASKISTKAAFEEAISQGYNGFYISSSNNNTYGRFATGDVAANIGGTATRTGIKGTLSSLEIRDKYAVQTSNNNVDTVSLTGKAEAAGAVRYYFEAAGDDSYYIYCLGDSGVKMYVYNSNIAGSYNSLAMTEDKNAAMKYKVADHGAAGNIEIICVDDACSDWRWQYTNTNVNGFVSRNSGNNDSKLWLWYCEKPESDPLGIDGKTYGLVNASVASDSYPAVMASSRNQGSNVKQLGAAPVAAATNPDGNSCFTSEYGISGWKFEWIEGTRLYKISVIADDGASKKYLKIVNGELSFVESADDASMIFVSVNSGDNNKGTVGLIAANGILKRYDDNKFQGVANAYNTSTSGLDYCFYLADVSDAGTDVFGLDGSSYALVNAYDTNQGNAVMCEYKSGTTNALANQAMWRTDTGFSFSGEITEWSFEHVDFNRYIIHATYKEGVERYIRLDSTGVKLSETPYILTLIPGTGDYEGTVKIINIAQRCQIKNNKGSSQFDKEDSITKNEKEKWLTFTDVPEDQQVSDPLGIDGKTYGIVNPGYNNKRVIIEGYAMVGNMSTISSIKLSYDSASGRFKVPDSLITAWTFHYTDHCNYILSTETADGTKYLKFGSGGVPSLVDEDQATPVYIEAGTGDRSGMVRIMPLLDGTLSVLYRGSFGRQAGFNNLSNDGAWHFLVDNADIFDPYSLNGEAYGLVYAPDTISGNALMAADDDTTYEKMYQIITHTNNDKTIKPVFISKDSDITEWTFICIAENIYHLKADNGKYLAVDGDNLVLTDSEDDASPFSVVLSGDGLIISSGGKYIGYNDGFVMSSQKVLLRPTEKSVLTEDDHITYTAEIISVSDGDQAYDGRELIVYTRIWNSKDKVYEIYAIDHDGSMKKCYINGDELMWLDNEMNTLLWKLTVYHDEDGNETGYYELQNLYSGMYLYPQLDGSYFTSSPKGIQLPGRLFEVNSDGTKTYGEFYSDIIAWDDDYYSYAALKGVPELDNSNNIKSVELQTAYMYGSDKSFYFAVPELIAQDEEELHTVDTIDNNLYGITMKMIDFDAVDPNNTNADNSSVTWNYFGKDTAATKGLLSKNLNEDGLPTVTYSKNAEQIGKTFDAFAGSEEVNHLFIQSIYEASGYFEFDSTQNTATLVGEDGTFGKDFTVYRELGTHDASGGPTRKHGQFFPYNTIKPGVYSDLNPQNLYTALAALLPDEDPRKYENLHHFLAQDSNGEWTVKNANKLDYYFGMEIEASFIQTPSGLDSWGHDIIFEFTGDDDFWLYVDGVLAIDLGGIHSAYGAKVNFRDGTITYPVGGNDSLPKTLREAFTGAYKEKNPDATESEIDTYLDEYFDGEVFKDYTQHTMKIFYMERGAGASNLHMRFNLSSVTEGKVLFAKSLTDKDGNELDESEVDLDKLKFPFQIEYTYNVHNDETNEDEPGEEWTLLGRYNIDSDNNATPSVSYHNSTQTVEFANEYISPNRTDYTYHNVFFLVPGRPLEIVFPEDAIWYRITECAVDTSIYGIELASGEIVEAGVTGSIKDLQTQGAQVKIQPAMNFKNKIDTGYIRNLDITKHLYSDREKENELSYEADQTTFNLRLYISDGTSEEVELANLKSYYVLDPEGYLCVRNVETKSFERYKTSSGDGVLGADVKNLTEAEKAKVTFHTSSYGAISKIPAGYTVRVPGLVAGTRFFIDERDYEMPVGYDLIDYADGKMGRIDVNPEPSYTHVSTYKLNGETITLPDNKKASAGIITQNYDPLVDVNNIRGWGIKAEKIWSDSDFVDKHDTVYLAVYTRDGPDDEPTLVEDSVRALTSGETEMRWYFDSLAAEKSISDYAVYEVKLNNPQVSEDGIVTYEGAPVRVEGGETIWMSVTDKGSTTSIQDEYTVTYSEPVLSDQNNAISQKIKNDRKGGIKIRLNEWYVGEGADAPLAGGEFELKCNGDVIDTFTSDAEGVVTVLYGFDDGDVYTLTQKTSPTGYVALKKPVSFKIVKEEEGTAYLLTDWTNSNDEDDDTDISDGKNWAEYVTDDTVYNAVIDIYNPMFVLRAVKVDSSNTSIFLPGVHFGLHRQVYSSVTGVAMDAKPMKGYEDLVSDKDGVIEKINSQIPPGVYYLVETQALEGYKMMEIEDAIQFRITDNGDVEMVREDQQELLSVKEGTYQMTISVPNTRDFAILTVTKSVNGSMGNKTASFGFTVKAGDPASYTSYTEVENTGDDPEIKEGEMMSFFLSDGQSFSLKVPTGVKVTVTEDNAGYSTTMKEGDKDPVSGSTYTLTLSEDTLLEVTNTLSGIVPTGADISVGRTVIVFMVVVSLMIVFMVRRRKYDDEQ